MNFLPVHTRHFTLLLSLVLITGCRTEGLNKTSSSSVTPPTQDFKYSFSKPPFINPRMVQDLNTWMSDMGDQVVSINVIDSQTSNRYYCKPDPEIIPQAKGCPYIFANTITVVGRGTNTSYFGYQFIGITSSGITVLKTVENGGGSGSFESLLLLKFEQDQQLNSDLKEGKAWLSGKRLLMKKVGQLSLGDRWGGELRVQGNKVVVGKDTGQYSYNTNDMVLDLELVH